MYRGKSLDLEIEKELQLMLAEGFDKSPISPAAVFKRLKARNVINGSLSTLSAKQRKSLIHIYKEKQLENSGLSSNVKKQVSANRTLQSYKLRLNDKNIEINQMKNQLDKNTEVLIDIILEVEAKSAVPIEKLLTPFLVKKKNKL